MDEDHDVGNDSLDSDGHHGIEEAREKESRELTLQRQAQRRAKKLAREREEATRLIDAAQGTRSAKQKGLENRVWLDGKKRPASSKEKPSVSKKAKVSESREDKEKKMTSKKKDKFPSAPISQRSPPLVTASAPASSKSKQPGHYQSKAKSSRKLKRKRSRKSGSSGSESSTSSDSETNEPSDEDSRNSSASDTSNEFDEELSDLGLTKLLESEKPMVLKETLAASRTRQASELFDVEDEEVEHVDHRRRSGSSSQMGPPTSDSEDPPSSILSSRGETQGDRSTRQPSPSPPRTQVKAARIIKSSNGRTEKFVNERPSIVSAPPRPRKSDKHRKPAASLHAMPGEPKAESDSESEADQWPLHTSIRGQGGLLQQNVHIRATCHRAIKIVEKTLVSEQAWPELHRVAEYRVEVLTQAAKALEKTDPQYRDIRKRVQKEDEYARILGKWVVDRLPHARGPVRQDALDHIAVFQLGINEMCAKRVTTLLATDTYVYPGRWETDSQGNEKWVVRGNQIYLNSGIINVLRSSFFSSPTALGYRYKEFYRSSHPDRPESELTVPLVALAATGIHAALDAWKDGNYIKKKTDKFDGETYKSIFNRHVNYLHGLKAKNINAYHSIMSEIHSKVIGNEGQDGVSHAQGNALAVLDLSGFD